MKLSLKYSLFITILLLLFSSCESEASKEKKRRLRLLIENPITWDTLQISRTIPFHTDSLKFEYTIDATYIFPQKYISEIYKNLLNSKLGEVVWRYSDESLVPSDSIDEKALLNFIEKKSTGYNQVMNEKMESWNRLGGDSIFNVKEIIDTRVLFNQANFVSYQIKTSVFRGHNDTVPEVNYNNLTFDLANGILVSEQDIFIDNFPESLNSLLAKKYQEYIDKNTQSQFLLNSSDISSNGNFYITPNGINYTYNSEEYGNALPIPLNLLISFKELSPIIKKDGLLDIFVKTDETK